MPVAEALQKILASVDPIDGYEQIPILDARGRTLFENVYAPFDVPGHNNAAVDGYGVSSEDIPLQGEQTLSIVGHVYAGERFEHALQRGQCIRITTGAPIPAGVDAVLMQEHVAVDGDVIRIDSSHKPGDNIRLAGEDLSQGEAILNPGKWLTPADIGLLASIGVTEIKVRRKLRIAVASTGDEIYALGDQRGHGGIYDSNRYSLQAALQRPDIELIDLGILPDKPDSLLQAFTEISVVADMIISSGGVSVGDADYTKSALKNAGKIDFWKIAIKPGRPLAFGKLQNSLFFGLPGNPVAVLVTFYQFVLPALERMLNITDKPISPTLKAVCQNDIRKKPGRTEVVRAVLETGPEGAYTVKTTGKQGSGILRSMSLANAFILLEHKRGNISAGETVTVQTFAGLIA